MVLTFAAGRTTLSNSDWSINTENTGSLSAGSYYFSIQGRNRAGKNELLISNEITINENDRINITINQSAKLSGEDWLFYAIGISSTNTPLSFNQIALVPIYDTFGNEISFPLTISFTIDSQLETGDSTSVATELLLPITNLIHGMRRKVISKNEIYEYDQYSTLTVDNTRILNAPNNIGRWIFMGTYSTFVSSVYDTDGCMQDIRYLDNGDILRLYIPDYAMDGSASDPIKFWIINNTNYSIPSGRSIILSVSVGGLDKSRLFDRKIYYSYTGYINPTTGIRRISYIDNTNLEFAHLNDYEQYRYSYPSVNLPDDLLPGEAIEISLYLQFNYIEIQGELPNGFVQIYATISSQSGNYNPINNLFQDENGNNGVIFNDFKMRRIVPDYSLSATALSGKGIVKGYDFVQNNSSFIFGFAQNTADQRILINKNGVCYYSALPAESDPADALLRALISTVAKESKNSPIETVTLNGTTETSLSVEVSYPVNAEGFGIIASNYPDVIANTEDGRFNAVKLNVYVENSSNIIRKYTFDIIPETDSQTILITSWTNTNNGTIPDNTPSLYTPIVEPTIIKQNAGNFPADTYEVSYSYEWTGSQITDISHRLDDGCIYEATSNLQSIFNSSWHLPANTKSAIRNLEVNKLIDGAFIFCLENDKLYRYDINSVESDNDNSILEAGSGAWLEFVSGGGGSISDGTYNHIIISDNGATYTLNNNSVTTTVINDNAVTTDKIIDNAITTNKITNNTITNNKLATVSQNIIKGRISSGSGNLEDLTGTQVTTLLDTFTTTLKGLVPASITNNNAKLLTGSGWIELSNNKGVLITANNSNFIALPVGSDNQILIADSNSLSGLSWIDNNSSVSTTTSASYIQPNLNSNVTITVGSTINMVVGSYINIAIGGHYEIITINSVNSVVIKYLGDGVSTGTSISSGKKIIPSGKAGSNGLSAITYTSSNFVVPVINSTVDISIPDSTIFNPEIYINIESAGIYFITEIVNSSTIRCKNLGGDNIIAGSTILSNSRIIITGAKGNTGSISAFTKSDTPYIVGSNDAALRVNTSDEVYIDLELSQKKLTVWDSVKDALLTGFTEGSLVAIAATDTIIQALGKVQKYINDYLTNFNTANNLVKLDELGKIPAIDGSLITNITYPVITVNTQSGDVILDADDISDTGTINKFVIQSDLDKLANIPANTNTELGNKQDTLISGTNIKTINSESLLGSGNITISGGSGGHTIQDEGVSLSARTKLNFIGSGVTVTDDSINDSTNVTIGGGGSAVDSVNSQTGTVILDADDISDSGTTKRFVTFTGDDISPSLIPNSFTEAKNFTLTTLTDGANIAWNLSLNQVSQVTLAGNRTLDNPTNQVAGSTYILIIKQDATGSRTLTFSSAYKFSGGVNPVLTTTANKVDIISFISDGTNMYGSFVGDF